MLMISADARFSEMDRLEFRTDTFWWPSMILAGYIRPVISGGDVVSEKSRAQARREVAKSSETIRPIPQNTAIALRVSTPNRVSGACSRSQAWAWQKSLPASHRLLRNTARVCAAWLQR
jgi:hypothetical protein